MSLSRAQKRIVENVLIDLLEFPLDPFEFSAEEEILFASFAIELDKSHKYYYLLECFNQPGTYFQTIETEGPPVTLGAVQSYILEYIDAKIKATGNDPHVWNSEAIVSCIPEINFQTPFTAQKAAVEAGESLWALPNLPCSIYTQTISIDESVRQSSTVFDAEGFPELETIQKLYVNIAFPNNSNISKPKKVYVQTLRGNFTTDAEEDEYIEEVKLSAIRVAEKEAAILTINFLARQHDVSANKIRKVECLYPFITHVYYFDLQFKKINNFVDIEKYTRDQVENLCDPQMVDFIKKKLLTQKQVTDLSVVKIRVLNHPVYNSMFEKKLLNLKDLEKLSTERGQFLVTPQIANLIQSKKLSFHQARQIPHYLKDVICHPSYQAFFNKRNIDWEQFQKMSDPEYKLLLKKFISPFIINEVLNFTAINNIFDKSSEPYSSLVFHIFTNRLIQVFEKTPCTINSIPDTLEMLLNEIPKFADKCGMDAIGFREMICYKLAQHIHRSIKEKLTMPHLNIADAQVYNQLLENIPVKFKPDVNNWLNILHQLVTIASSSKGFLRQQTFLSPPREKSTSFDEQITLFASPKKKQRCDLEGSNIFDLCDKLIALELFVLKLDCEELPRFAS